MPLFSSKFTPKTIPVRKQDTTVVKNEFGSDYASKELSIDVAPLKIKLGDFEISFDDGQWIPACLMLNTVSTLAEEAFLDLKNPRYSQETGFYYMKLRDDDNAFQAEFGYASGKAGAAHKDNIRLKSELEKLEEENNMLRLKFEILLDMMTDKTVESEQQELQRAQSLGSLKQKSKKSKW